jgi:hypothetical protein
VAALDWKAIFAPAEEPQSILNNHCRMPLETLQTTGFNPTASDKNSATVTVDFAFLSGQNNHRRNSPRAVT